MESAYTLANRELEKIRTANRHTAKERFDEALKRAPMLSRLEDALMKNGTALLECVLEKNGRFEEIKENIRTLRREKSALLEKNGFPADWLDDIYTCRECRDTGYIDGKRCSCLKTLIQKYIGANSNLTEYMRSQTFERFDFSLFANQSDDDGKTLRFVRKLCEKAMGFSEGFDSTHENLLIMGNAGTGKTYLSSCIANRALERGKTVYYQTAYRAFEYFEKNKFGKDGGEDVAEIVQYIYDTDLLIIDDLGTEFLTQFTSAAFFDIINSRIISGKSTVISTNLGMDALSENYSQRVTSRFVGNYTILPTVGCDLRPVLRAKSQ